MVTIREVTMQMNFFYTFSKNIIWENICDVVLRFLHWLSLSIIF